MIVIHRAILHILDFHSGVTVFSDSELTIENSVAEFLYKHLERAYTNQDLKNGVFYEDSIFKERLDAYTQGESLTFAALTRAVAEQLYAAISRSDRLDPCDLLFCDFSVDDRRMVALFKCNNRVGFIHQVTQTEEGVKNEIINHYAIMPNLNQKIDEYALIDPATLEIRFVEKKYGVEGESVLILSENILECTYTASPKTTLQAVHTVAKKVAEEFGKDSVAAVAKAKAAIAETLQNTDQIQPYDLGREIFDHAPELQNAYTAQMQEAQVAETVKVETDSAMKKIKNHRIKTDTGIELTIPLDYLQDSNYVEFVNHSDGTLSISLKNIMKLINK